MREDYQLDFFTGKFKTLPEQLRLICLGTTQAHFAVACDPAAGWANLALNVVCLEMYEPLLRSVERKAAPGMVVLIALEYPQFLCRGDLRRPEVSLQYARVLFGHDPRVGRVRQLALRLLPRLFIRKPPYTGLIKNAQVNEYGNGKSLAEIERYALHVITEGWQKETGLDDILHFTRADLKASMLSCMQENVKTIKRLVSYCKEQDYRPVVVTLPGSKIWESMIPAEFKQALLYDNLAEIRSECAVGLLDYAADERFADINYYIDFWFMNKRGRERFTGVLKDDLCKAGLLA